MSMFGGIGDVMSKATKAMEDAKKAAEEQASAFQEKANALQASQAFSQLESMMAATPGQLVADAREKAAESGQLASVNPLGSLDFDLLTPSKPASKPAASAPSEHADPALRDAVVAVLTASGSAPPAAEATPAALASALHAHGAAVSTRVAGLEDNIAQLEQSLHAEVARVSSLLAEVEQLRTSGAATAGKEARAAVAAAEAGHREELERTRAQSDVTAQQVRAAGDHRRLVSRLHDRR